MFHNVAVIVEDQPFREDVVGDHDDDVIDDLDNQLLERAIELQQTDADVHDDHVHDQGQPPVEVEPEELLKKGLDGRVVGAEDPDLVSKVGDQNGQEPGDHVSQLVVPMDPGAEKLEDHNVDDRGDHAPEEVGDDRAVPVEEGDELSHWPAPPFLRAAWQRHPAS